MRNIYIVVVVVGLFLIYGCYDVTTNWTLTFQNKSSRNISIMYSKGNIEHNENEVAYYIADRNIIKPDSTFTIFTLGGKDAWHDYIKAGNHKKLFIYVFEVDTLKKYQNIYSMDAMVSEHKYWQQLHFSEQQLIDRKWNIKFSHQ